MSQVSNGLLRANILFLMGCMIDFYYKRVCKRANVKLCQGFCSASTIDDEVLKGKEHVFRNHYFKIPTTFSAKNIYDQYDNKISIYHKSYLF